MLIRTECILLNAFSVHLTDISRIIYLLNSMFTIKMKLILLYIILKNQITFINYYTAVYIMWEL